MIQYPVWVLKVVRARRMISEYTIMKIHVHLVLSVQDTICVGIVRVLNNDILSKQIQI